MKKITFLIAFLLSSMLYGYAQQIPVYERTVLTGQTYTSITGGTTISATGTPYVGTSDDGYVLVTLPFTFTYAGSTFTQATFTSNGALLLGDQSAIANTAPARLSTNLFSTTAPNNILAAWFGDLNVNFGSGGSMVHGTAGTGVYAFEWKNAAGSSSTSTTVNLNFMIKIHGPASATPNKIELLYGTSLGVPAFNRSIGIEGATGGPGDFINALNGSTSVGTAPTAYPASGTGYSFLPNTNACSTPVAGTASIIGGCTPVIISEGVTIPLTGITYAWEESTDGGTNWAAAVGGSGANTSAYTPPAYAGVPLKYRLKVTCSVTTSSAVSNAVDFTGIAAPSTQASGLTLTSTPGQIVANWTAGNGTRRIVIVSDTPIPANYPQNQIGGAVALTGQAAYAGGEQTVYEGTGSTVTITGIPCSGGTYYVKVIEYTRCGTANDYTHVFNTTTGTNAAIQVAAPVAAPTTQATALTLTATPGQIVANWVNGNGNMRRVIVDTSPIQDLADQTGVAAPTVATAFANNGPQVVFDGTGSTVTVTGLGCAVGDVYYVKVIEYNRCGVTGNFDYLFNNTTGTNAATHTITAPTTQASALVAGLTYNSALLSWTSGNGANRIVVVSDTPVADPVDVTGAAALPAANTVYAGGEQIVYNGTASTVTVTGLTCGSTYYIKVFEYNRCGAVGNYTYTYNATTGTNAAIASLPVVALPQATNFTGFTGTNLAATSPNWFESRIATAIGAIPSNTNPVGVTSDWLSSTVFGTTTARVNLSANTKNEWLISPKMTITAASRIKFKAAITAAGAGTAAATSMAATTDDAVMVMISTDGCGAVWTPLYTFNSTTVGSLSNSLVDFSVPIDATYIGQNVQIAFRATDGPVDHTPTYDFHIGNVVVELVPSCDTPGVIATPFTALTKSGATVAWAVPGTTTPTGYQYVLSTTNTAPTGAGIDNADLDVTITTGMPSTLYYVFVRTVCGAEFSNWVMVASFTTLCDYPEVATTVPAARCGEGTVELSGTTVPGSTLFWYAAQTGGSYIATGNTFTTPVVTTNTNFYVAAGQTFPNTTIATGAGATTSTTYSNPFYSAWSNNHTQHIITAAELHALGIVGGPINSVSLDVTAVGTLPMIDLSVKIGTTTASTMAAFVNNASFQTVYTNPSLLPVAGLNTLTFTTPYIWDGTSNLVLEFCHGNGSSTATMSRTIKMDATSYVSSIKAQVSAATAASVICADTSTQLVTYSARPQFTFNATTACLSPRQAVAVTVSPPVAIAAQASSPAICAGQSTNLSVTSTNANYTYVWMPGNLSGTTQTVSPAATTTYTVTATDAGTSCVTTATVTVTVNAVPNAITVTPATAQVCNGIPVALTVTGANVTGNAVLGTGTTAPGATSHPNPFNAWFGGSKIQMLYRASELQAQGLVAGYPITSLTFNFAASVDKAANDLRIRIGSTTNTTTTAGFVPLSTLTEVYTNASYTPVNAATGPITFTFTTPYIWDGNNIIVEVVHNQGNSGNGSGTTTRATTTTFDSVYYLTKDSVTPAGAASFDALTPATWTGPGTYNVGISTTRPNIVFAYQLANPVVWAPTAGLYTDAAATTPYTGQAATTVYALPTANTTYVATATNAAGCIATDDTMLTIGGATPTGATSQTINANTPAEATIEDIVVNETGVIWYASQANAIAGINALPAGTQVTAGTTYYGTLSTGSCVPLAVTITEILGTKGGFDKAQFAYYPNPVKNVLNLKYSNMINGVEVYNLLGQKIITKEFNTTEATLDMSGIADGSYIVKVTSGNVTQTIKIVKKN